MTATTPPRPPQVTMLGSFVIGASAMLVLLAFDRVAALTTIEAQQDIADFLDTSSGEVLGLDADGMQTLIKAIWTFLGGAAVITSFLGWRVLQHDRRARLALSILVPLMLLSGSVVWQVNAAFSFDEMLTILVAVSTLLLWTQPARDWFAGRVPTPVAPRPSASAPTSPTSPTALPGYAPPPTSPSTSPSTASSAATSSATPPPPPDPWGRTPTAPPEAGRPPLPRPVVTAVVTTIVASSVVLAGCLVGLLGVVTDRSAMENAMADEISGRRAYDDLGLDPATLVDLTIGLLVVLLVWAILAIGLAAMVANRVNAARIALAVSAIGAALASLLGALLVAPLLVTAASITVAVVMLRSSTARWFAEQKRPR